MYHPVDHPGNQSWVFSIHRAFPWFLVFWYVPGFSPFLPLGLRQFYHDVPKCGFLFIYVAYSYFLNLWQSFRNLCVDSTLQIWKILGHYIFKYHFCLTLYCPSGAHIIGVIPFTVSHISLVLYLCIFSVLHFGYFLLTILLAI